MMASEDRPSPKTGPINNDSAEANLYRRGADLSGGTDSSQHDERAAAIYAQTVAIRQQALAEQGVARNGS